MAVGGRPPGQFVGQTAPTVAEAVRDAMGGCLFIDEAYALADRGGDKFSGEVIRTLLTEARNRLETVWTWHG